MFNIRNKLQSEILGITIYVNISRLRYVACHAQSRNY